MTRKITERTGERFARLAYELEGLSAALVAGDMATEARGAKAMAAEARNISNGILNKINARKHFGRQLKNAATARRQIAAAPSE